MFKFILTHRVNVFGICVFLLSAALTVLYIGFPEYTGRFSQILAVFTLIAVWAFYATKAPGDPGPGCLVPLVFLAIALVGASRILSLDLPNQEIGLTILVVAAIQALATLWLVLDYQPFVKGFWSQTIYLLFPIAIMVSAALSLAFADLDPRTSVIALVLSIACSLFLRIAIEIKNRFDPDRAIYVPNLVMIIILVPQLTGQGIAALLPLGLVNFVLQVTCLGLAFKAIFRPSIFGYTEWLWVLPSLALAGLVGQLATILGLTNPQDSLFPLALVYTAGYALTSACIWDYARLSGFKLTQMAKYVFQIGTSFLMGVTIVTLVDSDTSQTTVQVFTLLGLLPVAYLAWRIIPQTVRRQSRINKGARL